MTAGYFDDAAATDAAFAAGGGWFDTGDLGWRCPEVGTVSTIRADQHSCAAVLVHLCLSHLLRQEAGATNPTRAACECHCIKFCI